MKKAVSVLLAALLAVCCALPAFAADSLGADRTAGSASFGAYKHVFIIGIDGAMDKITRDRDIAAITLFALGLHKTNQMTARLPGDLFEDTPGEPRSVIRDPLDWFISQFMWIVTLLTPQR